MQPATCSGGLFGMKLPDDVLIVGLGMTGVATALFLAKMGKKITIVDEKPEKDLSVPLKVSIHSGKNWAEVH